MLYREFTALGSDIAVAIDFNGGDALMLLDEIQAAIIDFDKRFSRFIKGNELALFNSSKSLKRHLSSEMADILLTAQKYYFETDGVFDPSIIDSLETVGYNRSFTLLDNQLADDFQAIDLVDLQARFKARPLMSALQIKGRQASAPLDFRLDLGGIGKGYIVDYLSHRLLSEVDNYWFSAGGDILVAGNSDGSLGWEISVQDPMHPEADIFSFYSHGKKLGIATSGIFKRRGQSGGFAWHHLIDPRSGLPALNNIISVSVIANSALRADIFAKTVLILGEKEGLDFIDKQADAAAVIFLKNAAPLFSQRLPLFLKNI